MRTSSEQTQFLHQQQTYVDTVVTGSLIPTGEFNLGSATNKFGEVHVKSMFVGPSTVYIGPNAISASESGILLNGMNVVEQLKAVASSLTVGATGEMLVSTGSKVQWQPINLLPGPTGPTGPTSSLESVLADGDAGGLSLDNLAAFSAGTSVAAAITAGSVALSPDGVSAPNFTVNNGVVVGSSEITTSFGVGDTTVSAEALAVSGAVRASAAGLRFGSGDLGVTGSTLSLTADCLSVSAGAAANYVSLNLNGTPYKLRLA